MEIFAEILAAVFQFLLEILLQVAAEFIGELGLRGLREMFRPSRPTKPWLASIGYSLMGLLIGWLSLLIWPLRFARSTPTRLLSLAFAPLGSAAVLWIILTLIKRPSLPHERRQRLWLAYAFGLAFALVRFTYGK